MRTIKKVAHRGGQSNQLHDTTEERVLSMRADWSAKRATNTGNWSAATNTGNFTEAE